MILKTAQGDSPTASYVAEKMWETRRFLQRSHAIGNEGVLNADLADVWEECRQADWDGYGAAALSQDVLRNAYLFLESLPIGFPRPSLGADATGSITVEWYRGPRRQMSVAIDADACLHYAALIGPNRTWGTEVFLGDFPEGFISLLQRVYA
jgi:hypothetical protein